MNKTTIKADDFAKEVWPTIRAFQKQNLSLNEIAKRLNLHGFPTPKGLKGRWKAQTVKNIILRIQS
jgi:hypothetical protein